MRNRVTGRFLKGHTPHNKGKKWSDYLDKRKWKKIKRIGLKNLKPSANTSAGWNARRVVAVKDEKLICVYPSMREAEHRTGIHQKKIKRCCIGKKKDIDGYQWFFEDDHRWCDLINTK